MNHGKKFNHLKRKSSVRKALLRNLAKVLILKKRIYTTTAKAKALRPYIETLVTKSKINTTHSRRIVFSYFQDKVPVKELFDNISPKIMDRPGGYTRIIKLSHTRKGDNAEMSIIELVDFNELEFKKKTVKKTKTRRGGKKTKKSSQETKINTDKNTEVEENNQTIIESKKSLEGNKSNENPLNSKVKENIESSSDIQEKK